jgi:hypothetical protein
MEAAPQPTLASVAPPPAPAPGTASHTEDPHHETTLHLPSAGTIADTEPGHKNVHSPVPTANKKTEPSSAKI